MPSRSEAALSSSAPKSANTVAASSGDSAAAPLEISVRPSFSVVVTSFTWST
jgi:hypothetical protein